MQVKPVLVRLSGVDAGYDGRAVVHGVNLDVCADDVVALIGPNGGGKTTILKVLLGLVQPMSGKVERMPGLRIGYLPQINNVDFSFPIRVIDVVLSGQQGGNRIWPSKEVRRRAHQLLSFAHLADVADKPIGALSGGQRQRVFLCRAIMGNPHLLVLDEPVTYMDKAAETNLYKLLPQLAEQMAIVLVSHDIGTISSFVKSIACVNGTLQYHDSNLITDQMLDVYECPVEILTHGSVPHRVLKNHK